MGACARAPSGPRTALSATTMVDRTAKPTNAVQGMAEAALDDATASSAAAEADVSGPTTSALGWEQEKRK